MYSVALTASRKPVVKMLPSFFSPHISSIQSVVNMHPSYPMIACANTSGRVVILVCSVCFYNWMKPTLDSSLFNFMFTIHNLQPDVIEETATLGLGSNATVMLGFGFFRWCLTFRRYDNRDVALKIYKSNDYATKVEALNEVSIYSRLKNQPHVVNCYGMYYRNGAPVLVLEKAQKSLYNVYREERVSRAQYSFFVDLH